ncbi:hypothetical protein ERO13_A05G109350v2 [Gossypium hirsutum]|nr:hypothetical protein ERO13_A05G109350v2 [Gossypium hirsutum]
MPMAIGIATSEKPKKRTIKNKKRELKNSNPKK